MPGYESERFVNLTQAEKLELTCSICQDIFCSPVVAQCCLQSFCEDCINDWLKTNSSCPYDRKALTPNGLSRPPRVMMNMLGKLKIRCDFRDKGCKEVLALEDLVQHTVKCRYNVEKVKKCKKCFCEQKSGHDCIKALLELNKKANEEIDALKRMPKSSAPSIAPTASQSTNNWREQSLVQEIRDLKLERDNFLKTIQDLSNSTNNKSPKKPAPLPPTEVSKTGSKPNFTASSDISEQEIFNEARKFLWKHEIVQNETNKDVTNKILSIVRDQIREYNSVYVVCKNICEKLNQEFGNRWHCMADHKSSTKSYFTYESGFLIKLRFGLLFLEIYKTQFLNVQQLRQRFRNGKIKREIQILRTDMKQSMISDVKKITFAAIENLRPLADSLMNISSEIKTQMESKHSGKWQCFIFSYYGVFGIHHTCGTFISFDLAELTITLFQAIP